MDKNQTYFCCNQHDFNAWVAYPRVHVIFQVEMNCTERVWKLQVGLLYVCPCCSRSRTAIENSLAMPKEEAGLGIWMVVRDCTAATSESKQIDERITWRKRPGISPTR